MKKKLKPIITTLLLVIIIVTLGACSNSNEGSEEDIKTALEDSSSQEAEQSPAEPQEDNSAGPEKAEENEPDGEVLSAEIVFEEITVVNNEECTIKITEINPDNMWGYTLKAYLENKSSDVTYMFSVTSASINGVQCDPLFASEVTPENKSNQEISFATDSLEGNGVTDFTDIELSFRVHDSNDWMADPVVEETVHVYPYGEENIQPFVREPQSTDDILVDNDDVTIIVTGYDEAGFWGYTVNLFLLNKTNKNIMFSANDVSVNGYMSDPFFATAINAGKCAFTSMSWPDTTFEENGITTVEEIEVTFRAHDADDVTAGDIINETFTLIP